jgi:hypothetical protein
MDSKFFCSLFEGDSPNGIKLGMGLTSGEFWPRINGCQNLYRGAVLSDIDFISIIAAYDTDDKILVIDSSVPHEAGMEYLYVLRRANQCGDEESSLCASVVVAFDEAGELSGSECNTVIKLGAKQLSADIVELYWYYCPLNQLDDCAKFNLYYNGGTGSIDYDNCLTSTPYIGPKHYTANLQISSTGRYLFAVRAVSSQDLEENSFNVIAIEMNTNVPESVQYVDSKQV